MKKILLFFSVLAIVLAAVLWIRYGGGEPYPDSTGPPLLAEDALEEVLSYPEPIGNVAVSKDGRIFFTVHPESRTQGNKLLQYVDGAAEPFPDVQSQDRLFDAVLGVVIDRQNRLWTIDHGNHGLRTARLLAFDLESGDLIHDRVLTNLLRRPGHFYKTFRLVPTGGRSSSPTPVFGERVRR